MKKNMEKINAQKNINAEAILHYQLAYAEYNALPYGYKPARLRSCSATVYETTHYYLLRSYNTVVACIDKSTGICYDVLRHVFRVYLYFLSAHQQIYFRLFRRAVAL